jgi:hypothetical protein
MLNTTLSHIPNNIIHEKIILQEMLNDALARLKTTEDVLNDTRLALEQSQAVVKSYEKLTSKQSTDDGKNSIK